jgi:hypothetical protein
MRRYSISHEKIREEKRKGCRNSDSETCVCKAGRHGLPRALSHAWPNKLDFSGEDEDIAVSATVQAWESWATLEERACSVAGHPSPARRRAWSTRPRSC